jgi:hypothetical protein
VQKRDDPTVHGRSITPRPKMVGQSWNLSRSKAQSIRAGSRIWPFVWGGKGRKGTNRRAQRRRKSGQGKTTVAPRECERTKCLTRGRVKDCGRSLLGLSLFWKNCTSFD